MGTIDPLRSLLLKLQHRGPRMNNGGPRNGYPLGLNPGQVEAVMPTPPPQTGPFNDNNTIVVCVVGCGKLGGSIAGEMLRRGCAGVRCYDPNWRIRDKVRVDIFETAARSVAEGSMMPGMVESMLSRCIITGEIEEAVNGACLIIEATPEHQASKQEVFEDIAQAMIKNSMTPDGVVLASTTMSLAPHALTARIPEEFAERVMGMRFLPPSWFVDDVELTMNARWCAYAALLQSQAGHPEEAQRISSMHSAQPAYNAAESMLRALGFRPLRKMRWTYPRQLSSVESQLYKQMARTRVQQTMREQGLQYSPDALALTAGDRAALAYAIGDRAALALIAQGQAAASVAPQVLGQRGEA